MKKESNLNLSIIDHNLSLMMLKIDQIQSMDHSLINEEMALIGLLKAYLEKCTKLIKEMRDL